MSVSMMSLTGVAGDAASVDTIATLIMISPIISRAITIALRIGFLRIC